MKELEQLLESYWIIKDDDKELYYSIKDSISGYRSFITEKLGYQVLVNPYLIKLEKVPGKAESWMGIRDFSNKLEYIFFCLLLMFLEDRDRGEQFVLSEITEFIQGSCPGDEKVDWTLYRHRRYLIKVLRVAQELGLININDGDEQSFAAAHDAEILYENSGISRYFVRSFTGNIMNYSSYKDIENEEWLDIEKDKGIIRRNRVYRRLIMSPAVYREGDDEDGDYLYIKNYRNMLQSDIEKYLGCSLHVHKNGAFMVLGSDKNYKSTFPETKAISEIVLQTNAAIVEAINKGLLIRQENDVVTLSLAQFESILREVRNANIRGWSKEYREMSPEGVQEEIIKYMEDFLMLALTEDGEEVNIMPLAGKVIGSYPEDFTPSETGVMIDEG